MFLAIPFLLLVGVALPLMSWMSFRLSRKRESNIHPSSIEFRVIAVQTFLLQTAVAGLALLAAYGINLELAWQSDITVQTATASLAVLFGFIAVAIFEARRKLDRSERIRAELRKVRATDPMWVSVTLVAGFVEELAYRGVLTLLLSGYMDYWLAAITSAVLFGLGHFTAGIRGAVVAFLFAVAMQWLVYLSGGLFLAIAVHAVYDLLAAWLGNRIEKQRIEKAGAMDKRIVK